MDQGVRIVLSIGIVAGGTALALLVRQPSAPSRPTFDQSPQSLVVRGTVVPAPEKPIPIAPVHRAPVPAAEPSPRATPPPARASLDNTEPPPLLARSYPEPPKVNRRDGMRPQHGQFIPGYEIYPQQIHKIVDGDTLSALAKQYLGAADRAWEIYEANRNVLPSPDILPIGVELRIPAMRAISRVSPRDSLASPDAGR